MGERGERGETVAFEKAPQNFYTGGGAGYSLCKSDCSPIWFCPFPEKIVRERLTESSALYGERLRDVVYWWGWICFFGEELLSLIS